ncbi:hypothetical protein E2C01_047364 [Portunus trituberculatus]|uniref:Uncharacterized protein n=1 Tax=Portunus trituberculatus TaxID=210409 RepID=A0A5B7G084_PORTR|nr:hypothetical protein [Portunus trituberculatus]
MRSGLDREGEGREPLGVIHNAATTNKEGGTEGTRGQTGSGFSSCEYYDAAKKTMLMGCSGGKVRISTQAQKKE